MALTPEQEKRFADFASINELYNRGLPVGKIQAFLDSELQLERERLLLAFGESASVFFREHDMKPCNCLLRYVERFAENVILTARRDNGGRY